LDGSPCSSATVKLAGANEYVTKPFKTEHIVALVQKYSSLDRN